MSAEPLLEHFCSSHGVSFHLKKSDFVRRLCEKNISTKDLSSARISIFSTAQSMGQADKRAVIVSRCGTSLNPLKEKLAGDVWDLAQSVTSKTRVKRVMFKNGERSQSYIKNNEMKGTKGASTNSDAMLHKQSTQHDDSMISNVTNGKLSTQYNDIVPALLPSTHNGNALNCEQPMYRNFNQNDTMPILSHVSYYVMTVRIKQLVLVTAHLSNHP